MLFICCPVLSMERWMIMAREMRVKKY